jgi:ribosomal protein L25 (general stress protein Ctc)
LYGAGSSQALELNGREIAEALHGASSESVLIDLTLEGEGGATTKKMALIREVQHDPLRDTIEHVDFHAIEENKKLRVEVPVHELGEAVFVAMRDLLQLKTGGDFLRSRAPAQVHPRRSHLVRKEPQETRQLKALH